MTTEYTKGQFERDLNEGRYTSVGSYPKFWFRKNGDLLCYSCVVLDRTVLLDSWESSENPIIGCQVNWESRGYYCECCGKELERAYQ